MQHGAKRATIPAINAAIREIWKIPSIKVLYQLLLSLITFAVIEASTLEKLLLVVST